MMLSKKRDYALMHLESIEKLYSMICLDQFKQNFIKAGEECFSIQKKLLKPAIANFKVSLLLFLNSKFMECLINHYEYVFSSWIKYEDASFYFDVTREDIYKNICKEYFGNVCMDLRELKRKYSMFSIYAMNDYTFLSLYYKEIFAIENLETNPLYKYLGCNLLFKELLQIENDYRERKNDVLEYGNNDSIWTIGKKFLKNTIGKAENSMLEFQKINEMESRISSFCGRKKKFFE